MVSRLAWALSLLGVLAVPAIGQVNLVCFNGGDGSDGIFAPATNVTLDTDVQAVYNYISLNIPSGVTVSVIGSQPITIKVQGGAQIDGTLDASGQPGTMSTNNTPGGAGGAGGPGGGAGGGGAASAANPFMGTGQAGQGPGGGPGGMDCGSPGGSFTDNVGGGGGGGNATAGMPGGPANAGTMLCPPTPGGPVVMPCRTGSGGGGGGGDIDSTTSATSNDGGGGGGGGGGQLCLYADASITVTTTGAILADGGAGGTSGGNGGGGGGGSGGFIELVSPTITVDGNISAVGGMGGPATQTNCGCSPGGAGGDGCIEIRSAPVAGFGTLFPVPTYADWSCMVTAACPAPSILVNGMSGDTYIAAISFATVSPGIPVGGIGNFQLDLFDPLFQATFPVNTLFPLVQGLSGMVGGPITINMTGLPPGFDQEVFAQAISLTAGVPSGISPVRPIRIKF